MSVEDINKNKPHFVLAVMCTAQHCEFDGSLGICNNKWIAVVEPGSTLFKLECPECGEQDSFATVLPPDWSII